MSAKKKFGIDDPLTQAAQFGTIGGKSPEAEQGRGVEKPVADPKEQAASKDKRERLTAYLPHDIAKWTKVQAAQQEREISEIVEEALRLYKAGLQD